MSGIRSFSRLWRKSACRNWDIRVRFDNRQSRSMIDYDLLLLLTYCLPSDEFIFQQDSAILTVILLTKALDTAHYLRRRD